MRRHFTSAFLAAALVAACTPAEPGTRAHPADDAGPDAAAPDLVLHDARLLRLVDGKTVARVSAAEVRYRRERGEFAADQVRASLLPSPQARALESFGAVEIVAPRVLGDSSTRVVRGEGGVSAQASRGDRAHGESVVWDGPRKLIHSEQPVSLEGGGYAMSGGALEASTDGERFELSGGAHGTLTHRENK